jgi:hypothetical protein
MKSSLAMVTDAPLLMVTRHDLYRIQPLAIKLSLPLLARTLRVERGAASDDAGALRFTSALIYLGQILVRSLLTVSSEVTGVLTLSALRLSIFAGLG